MHLKKQTFDQSNLPIYATNNGHKFLHINNTTFIKHILCEDNIMNIWGNLYIYNPKANNKVINEQIQTNNKSKYKFQNIQHRKIVYTKKYLKKQLQHYNLKEKGNGPVYNTRSNKTTEGGLTKYYV